MCKTHQVHLSKCNGYMCNKITAINYVIEEFDDKYAHIVMEDDNETAISMGSDNPVCLECIATDNIDRSIETVDESSQGSSTISTKNKSRFTSYTIELNDVNGKPYVKAVCFDAHSSEDFHIFSIPAVPN